MISSLSSLKTAPLLAALAVSMLFGVAWWVFGGYAHFEVPFMAWPLGAIVGWAASLAGSRGKAMGVCAAVMFVAALAFARLALFATVLAPDFDAMLRRETFSEANYTRIMEAARFLPDPLDAGACPAFMVEHGFVVGRAVDTIPPAEAAIFQREIVPVLLEFQREQPSLTAWQDRFVGEVIRNGWLSILIGPPAKACFDFLMLAAGAASAYVLARGAETRAPEEDLPQPGQLLQG